MNPYFSPDYDSARSRFRTAVSLSHGRLEALQLDATGPQGQDLTIDVAWFGTNSPDRVLIHSSGLHGVEGFAGSAIQLQLLDALAEIPQDSALILVHCLNPFGMAWLRRSNENNVDLNRNVLEDGQYSGVADAYSRLNSFLNPESPPARDFFVAKAAMLVARYGMPAMRQAVAGGQYEFPRGLFFGGKRLQQGLQKYREYLTAHLKTVRKVLTIDVHTGLGRYGQDMLLVDADKLDHARKVYGANVVPLDPQKGPAYRVRGGLQSMLAQVAPQAVVHFIGQEFGTYGSLKMLHTLREENRWHHYGKGELPHITKQRLCAAFNPPDPRWQDAVLRRGQFVFNQAWQELMSAP